MKAFEIPSHCKSLEQLRLVERSDPQPGTGSPPLHMLMRKGASIHGILVGSRAMFERMNQAISAGRIQPVIDRVFAFDKAVEALRYHQSGAHFGKVVIGI